MRSDDAALLKKLVVTWVNGIFGDSKPPLLQKRKEGRGFDNDFTGRLLCPAEWSWDDERYGILCADSLD